MNSMKMVEEEWVVRGHVPLQDPDKQAVVPGL